MRPHLLVAVLVPTFAAALAVAQAQPKAPGPGTVTNPPISGSAIDPSAPSPATQPKAPHADSAVRQQADANRRQALEQCQTMTGASRIDCVKRADEAFKRATSDDTLSDRGGDPFFG
jgi:hypothetical protein